MIWSGRRRPSAKPILLHRSRRGQHARSQPHVLAQDIPVGYASGKASTRSTRSTSTPRPAARFRSTSAPIKPSTPFHIRPAASGATATRSSPPTSFRLAAHCWKAGRLHILAPLHQRRQGIRGAFAADEVGKPRRTFQKSRRLSQPANSVSR